MHVRVVGVVEKVKEVDVEIREVNQVELLRLVHPAQNVDGKQVVGFLQRAGMPSRVSGFGF